MGLGGLNGRLQLMPRWRRKPLNTCAATTAQGLGVRCGRRRSCAHPCTGRASCNCRGMVSAELALTLPAVIAVLALVLGLAAVGVRQVQAVGAANAAARAQLAGEDPYAAAARAYGAAQISVSGECAQASVSLPPILNMLGWTIRATACAPRDQP